mmetsp:Transcript_17429/g.44620  ORF Transcript_17429/g.44620 Transcript_17429/m.44620 type:complete len:266 (+) Transcript_17429:1067-1864(+)
MIMLQPVSAIALITFSSDSSSELLYALSSSADFRRTVPLVSVVTESSGMPYTAIFTSLRSLIEPSTPRVMHIPLTTDVPRIELPMIFATRMLSVLNLAGSEGIARQHASAIFDAKSSSLPHCLAAMTGLRQAASATASLNTVGGGVDFTSESSTSRHLADAAVYPAITSEQCRPFLSSVSASWSSSPPSTTTRLVPSPDSASCILDASTSILAAGCCTSSSCTIVAESLVMNSFSRWLITILFMPFGPSDVRTIWPRFLAASIFL